MQKNTTNLIKWLKLLLYCEIAALAFSLLDYIPIGSNLFTWLKRICQAGSILCLFAVAFAGKRYLAAAIFGSVQLVLTVAQSVIFIFVQLLMRQGIYGIKDFETWNEICTVLNLVAMVASWIYTYQLYHAHGDLIKEQDASLCRKWYHLFFWALAAGIFTTVASMIFSTVYMKMGLNTQSIVTLFYSLIKIPVRIIMLFGILYLNRTIQIIQNRESMPIVPPVPVED